MTCRSLLLVATSVAASLVASVASVAHVAAAPTSAASSVSPSGGAVRVEHVDTSTMPTRGPSAALVTVELFFAPGVNANARFSAYRQLEELQARHPTRIRLVYRVIQRGAQQGPMLPTLALEAYAQGKYGELMSALNTQRANLSRDQMLELARRVGLDVVRVDRALTDGRYRTSLEDNERRLERLRGVTAPMVYFNARPLAQSLSSLKTDDLENAYLDALDRANEEIDRGTAPRDLMTMFDAQALGEVRDVNVTLTSDGGDDTLERDVVDHPLASPPLPFASPGTRLPSLGRADAAAPMPVFILCRPTDERCNALLRVAPKIARVYRGELRVVWAPWFDVLAREDSADLALLGDAALCAERIGSSPDDLDASPGWLWVSEMYAQIGTTRGRRMTADKLIDEIAGRLKIDRAALSACRARTANDTLDWVERARKSGVTGSPAIVIGGRIYEGLDDERLIRALVEAELAPGVLGRCATTGCT